MPALHIIIKKPALLIIIIISGILTFPAAMLAGMFICDMIGINPHAMVRSVTAENRLKEDIYITPIATYNKERIIVEQFRWNCFPYLRTSETNNIRISAGAKKKIYFNCDEYAIFSDILVKTKDWQKVLLVRANADSIRDQYKPPDKDYFVIDSAENLQPATNLILSALDKKDFHKSGFWPFIVSIFIIFIFFYSLHKYPEKKKGAAAQISDTAEKNGKAH